MFHKDYGRKSSVAKIEFSGRESQGTWSQDEMIGGKPVSRKINLTLALNMNDVVVGQSSASMNVNMETQNITGIRHQVTTGENTADRYYS
jgi:hypothetical protein